MRTIKASCAGIIAVISMVLANEAMGSGILTTVNWVSDTYNSYDVILSGTGLGWAGTVSSPSGLWQVDSDNFIEYSPEPYTTYSVDVGNTGDAVYLGQLPSQYPTPTPYQPSQIGGPNLSGAAIYSGNNYVDVFQPIAPINDGNWFGEQGSYLCQGRSDPVDYPNLNWSGSSTISVTSIPNVNDTSTWTWQAEYYASGTSLQPAPEPATISIATLATVLGIASIKRKQRKLDC
jgi:hypothetical protein